jgi:hypothetical protein
MLTRRTANLAATTQSLVGDLVTFAATGAIDDHDILPKPDFTLPKPVLGLSQPSSASLQPQLRLS